MARNKMSDLRDHLFETLEALQDKESPMDPARAKVISDVAQTIINTAKAEIDLLKVIEGNRASEFFDATPPGQRAALEEGSHPKLKRMSAAERSCG